MVGSVGTLQVGLLGRIGLVLRGKVVPGPARNFMGCKSCRAIVPSWRMVSADPKAKIGCPKCGSSFYGIRYIGRPGRVSLGDVYALWWVFVRGMLIRYIILGHHDTWDPRIAVRQ